MFSSHATRLHTRLTEFLQLVASFGFYMCLYCVNSLMSLQSSSQCVGLLDIKAQVRIPDQTSKRNMKKTKYFFGNFLSADFWQKLRVNKSAMKQFLENLLFRIDIKQQVSLTVRLTSAINVHNMSGVRSKAVILTEEL